MHAAIYARRSTDQTGVADEAKSVTRQIEQARAYADRKGWTVDDAHVYSDDGISGAEFAKRPGFVRLMNALKPTAPFQALIMSEGSRLGRESIETPYAVKQLVTAGVRVFFYLEDRERTLDSPTDKVMLSLTAFADELEREKASQRTRDALEQKAKAGHVTGGIVFGYDNERVDGHVERRINAAEAEVVREIFTLYASGVGLRGIAKRLNEKGALSPRPRGTGPRGWAPSSLSEVLKRPLYGSPKVHVGPELAEGAPGGPVTGAFPGFSLGVLVMGQGPVSTRRVPSALAQEGLDLVVGPRRLCRRSSSVLYIEARLSGGRRRSATDGVRRRRPVATSETGCA